jgi:hypothetical protein
VKNVARNANGEEIRSCPDGFTDHPVTLQECQNAMAVAPQKRRDAEAETARRQAAYARCHDPQLLETVRRGIAERLLDDRILQAEFTEINTMPSDLDPYGQCFAILRPLNHVVEYRATTFNGQNYVVWNLR